MKLWSLMGNSQKLDGGAMFGNAPRAMWSRWAAPDDANRIALACRALLATPLAGRTVLFEAGIGAFFEPKLRERYGVVEDRHVLLESLADAGFAPEDIDVVVLSHLHFDHAGGLLAPYREGEPPRLVFPNAPGLMLAEIAGPDCVAGEPHGGVVFCADLIPGRPWVHVPITMGYDRNAELLIDEKREFLEDKLARNVHLFFTHDPGCALAQVTRDAKGRFGTAHEVAELHARALAA